MPNFPTQHRNQRPPLLPTPNIPATGRYSRNMSINSDSSKGPDELESSEIDMELSDDDVAGIDSMAAGKIFILFYCIEIFFNKKILFKKKS